MKKTQLLDDIVKDVGRALSGEISSQELEEIHRRGEESRRYWERRLAKRGLKLPTMNRGLMSNQPDPLADFEWTLTASPKPKPSPQPSEVAHENTDDAEVKPDPRFWFTAWVEDGVARVMILDQISSYRLEELLDVLKSAGEVELVIVDCRGGSVHVAEIIVDELRRKPKTSVSCIVRGKCNSAALMFLPCCGKVVASRDATFGFHFWTTNITPSTLDESVRELLGGVLLSHTEFYLGLAGRMGEHAQRLASTGSTSLEQLNAWGAFEFGLVDQVD